MVLLEPSRNKSDDVEVLLGLAPAPPKLLAGVLSAPPNPEEHEGAAAAGAEPKVKVRALILAGAPK